MKVICTNIKCKYCNLDNICKRKNIELILNGVNTVNQGFKNYLECKSYKKSKIYEELQKRVKEALGDKDNA